MQQKREEKKKKNVEQSTHLYGIPIYLITNSIFAKAREMEIRVHIKFHEFTLEIKKKERRQFLM